MCIRDYIGNRSKMMKWYHNILVYLRMITLRRILHIYFILRKEGISGLKYHFYLLRDQEKGSMKFFKRSYDVTFLNENMDIEVNLHENSEMLRFQEYKNPLVSILIPVYDQFAFTYNCLKHIKKYTENISYEIIVGDDHSNDLTTRLGEIVKGIQIIRQKENIQFLRNCNKISEKARGKYLVFLNNDTQVQFGWLESLVRLMEMNENIGLAGSKLVYPNGLVQEAGGIVWQDASVLQYGQNRQAGEEQLNIRRETDYISAASIIIKKELWDKIGGFDEQFVPAYYEDVDLAFQVRKEGYLVVYEPASEVVHFEGITERNDKERKEKIEVNRKKFIRKWKKELQSQHYKAQEYKKMVKGMRKI